MNDADCGVEINDDNGYEDECGGDDSDSGSSDLGGKESLTPSWKNTNLKGLIEVSHW